ncbi:MAG: gamma-glutamyl-gamma-aminobutyrate hydrolase family protein [Bacteroidaceae bacterium]|nr:gamma-glutamyl-gamma-aminobutyrate hydrolase family protein [Bacteroidaceae bacterium]
MDSFDINTTYRELTSHYPTQRAYPLIGIMGNYGAKGSELAEAYYRSIEAAGGMPVVIPPVDNPSQLYNLLARIDGLMLSGGADVNPLYWGEDPLPQLGGINSARDKVELLAVRLAYDCGLPMFGICRGVQVIVAALGGKVYQDTAAEHDGGYLIKHSQDAPRFTPTHRVQADSDSLVAKLLGTEFAVNSFHHQAVKEGGPKLRITARSADGVAEVVESNEMKSIWGVQWHPESFIMNNDRRMMPLFQHFVQEAESYRKAREVHRRVLTLDSHCDTPMVFDQGVELCKRNTNSCVDLYKMYDGALDAAVMAAYLPQGGRSADELLEATITADRILAEIRRQVEASYSVQIATIPKDLFNNKMLNRKSIMLGIENGYAIGKDLSNIERYRKEGVVYMTLCHNGDNDICDSASRSKREHGGLSEFGKQVVAEMNRVGMMIDLSHASEETFYQTLETSTRPVLCSHSSSKALCNHPRNLTDDQVRALAEKGGVVQATLYEGFLVESGEATIDDAVRHIMHLIDVAGIEHVGIGSDFDGDGGVRGLRTAADYLSLTRRLMAEGLNERSLRKLWGGNFVRVMSRAQYNTLFQSGYADQ